MIKSYAAYEVRESLRPFSYVPRELGELDVEITISHCGICHSDIHLINNDWGISQYPLVPGHEIVGTITAVGKKVTQVSLGDRAGVGWQCGSCFECDDCTHGDENLCASSHATCVGNFGGYAEKVVVDSRFAFRIPESLDSAAAAPLLCGGATVYSPMLKWKVKPGSRVGVIGIGGLGHLAIQFAKALGAEVTAFSSTPEKEQEARALGADHFSVSTEASAAIVLKGYFDFIINTVWADLDWQGYVTLLRSNGVLCFVGLPGKPITIHAGMLLSGQKSITASVIGSRKTIESMLKLAASKGVGAKTELYPMSEVNQALEHAGSNKARYRVVLYND